MRDRSKDVRASPRHGLTLGICTMGPRKDELAMFASEIHPAHLELVVNPRLPQTRVHRARQRRMHMRPQEESASR